MLWPQDGEPSPQAGLGPDLIRPPSSPLVPSLPPAQQPPGAWPGTSQCPPSPTLSHLPHLGSWSCTEKPFLCHLRLLLQLTSLTPEAPSEPRTWVRTLPVSLWQTAASLGTLTFNHQLIISIGLGASRGRGLPVMHRAAEKTLI